ncbi:hypothetical protein QE152_g35915 [Popillia japonica]|uniref:Uncharacterized protein n=1 Tax=Popillia japonica TaxID=7064 RepID=A0AAW1IES4_POPJA
MELQTKAASCELGELKDRLIKDRIVCGVRDKNVQRRLLREGNITLNEVVKICVASEISEKQARIIQDSSNVDAIQKWKGAFSKNHGASTRSEIKSYFIDCTKCKKKHKIRECPAFGKFCLNCKGRNHFAAACKKNLSHKGKNDNGNKNSFVKNKSRLDNIERESNDSIDEEFFISEINSNKNVNIWYADIKVDDRHLLKFKLDTGAEVYPLKDLKVSPAEMMLNRRLRTRIPILTEKLNAKIEEDVKEKKDKAKLMQKKYFDIGSKELKPLSEGESVLINKGKEPETSPSFFESSTPPVHNPTEFEFKNMNPQVIEDNRSSETESPPSVSTRPKRNIRLPDKLRDYELYSISEKGRCNSYNN